jgi:hypothetical protein
MLSFINRHLLYIVTGLAFRLRYNLVQTEAFESSAGRLGVREVLSVLYHSYMTLYVIVSKMT